VLSLVSILGSGKFLRWGLKHPEIFYFMNFVAFKKLYINASNIPNRALPPTEHDYQYKTYMKLYKNLFVTTDKILIE
jgi:hypothetical protein